MNLSLLLLKEETVTFDNRDPSGITTIIHRIFETNSTGKD